MPLKVTYHFYYFLGLDCENLELACIQVIDLAYIIKQMLVCVCVCHQTPQKLQMIEA